jgi:hypothetical protein
MEAFLINETSENVWYDEFSSVSGNLLRSLGSGIART